MLERLKPMIRNIVIIYWVLAIYFVTVYGILGDVSQVIQYTIKALAWSWLYVRFFSEEESV